LVTTGDMGTSLNFEVESSTTGSPHRQLDERWTATCALGLHWGHWDWTSGSRPPTVVHWACCLSLALMVHTRFVPYSSLFHFISHISIFLLLTFPIGAFSFSL